MWDAQGEPGQYFMQMSQCWFSRDAAHICLTPCRILMAFNINVSLGMGLRYAYTPRPNSQGQGHLLTFIVHLICNTNALKVIVFFSISF